MTTTTPTTTTTTEAEQLRWEIERQRSVLGRDLEALGDHVSPGRIVERRKAAAGQRVRRFRDTVMGTAESAGQRAGAVGGTVTDGASSFTGTLADGATSLSGAMGQAPEAVMERTKGAPLGMGLVTFGIGFVAGSLLPSTRKEIDLVRKAEPALELAAEGAGTAAREGAENLKPKAEEAAQVLKDDAADAARAVQDKAKDGVAEVQADARSGAEQVAGEVRSQ